MSEQPRTPAGSPQGGQFASNPGGGEGPHLTDGLEYGPNTVAVQTILDRVKTLTPDEMERMYDVWGGSSIGEPWDVAWDVAAHAARTTTRVDGVNAARFAVHNTMMATTDDTTDPSHREAAAASAGEAVLAEATRDLISEEHYNLLMAPWRAGVGTGNE